MLHTPRPFRSSFWLKFGLDLAVVAVADLLLFLHLPGTSLGLFALTMVAAVIIVRPGLARDRRALVALVAAIAFGLVLVDRPGLLALALFGLVIAVAVLSARVRAGETAWGWSQRLGIHGLFGLIGPLFDLLKLARLKRRRKGRSLLALLGLLAMPVVGGAIFLALFSAANPLISDALDRITLPPLSPEMVLRVLFWLMIATGVWGVLRPHWKRPLLALPARKSNRPSPALTTSITWSLIVFNVVFALQNGLDIAFLWSGAPLPGDMGLADYAHRGAWPLIVTTLLAGLFVLVALQPGSDTARRPGVRLLVIVWVAQNMLLVASSLLRTADYIEAYALTRFRIAAMVWMILVGAGLLLIGWRMLRDRSAHWLINANVAITLGVLAVISVVDLGAVAAAWNVRHAREVGGRGVDLDLGYLHSLGEPALVSLVELERAPHTPAGLRDRAAAVRRQIVTDIDWRQNDWHSWRWRTARRMERIQVLSRDRPLAVPLPGERDWAGRLKPPPPPPAPPVTLPRPEPAYAPLTLPAGG
ncbi:DUF4173 domain-containing protein [Brevundimonas sp.]|uniref:DUF4153 domain-containing protein n=1 Tax=Brevundimonas sp. TaxID=1871086 RepID=UPI00248993A6|nr:DUF4173 domain-containing protein [Brevundimonas sp.]MDI1280137.1 DUF4173 domain-containing protein [Brevundimonas sp.]